MSGAFAGWDERTLELAVDQVTVGLEAGDLEVLRARADSDDLEAFEQVVAAIHLGAVGRLEAPPPRLMSRLQSSALDHAGGRVSPPRRAPSRNHPHWVTLGGWLAAAAMLLAFLATRSLAPPAPDAATRRDELIASAGDLQRASWSRTEDQLAGSVRGDVVWSSERQEGYMHFHGLSPNDPTRNQYQLWVFDSTRAEWEANPVDGGVFDVDTEGDVVVPIDAKLSVQDAALFAVTLEVPGGVVVSKRERLIVTASP